MTKNERWFFRFWTVAICLNYWADAGTKLVYSGGSAWGWIHIVLASASVVWFIPAAWRITRPRPQEETNEQPT